MLNSPKNLLMACVLSALAGYVDGIGFVHLGGLFVSFMSGNTTRLGLFVASENWGKALEALGLIGLFIAGSAVGSLIVQRPGKYRQPFLLLVEAALLALATLAYERGSPDLAIGAIVLAMGLENAFFQTEGGGSLALTYVTGALVRVGQLLAAAITGGAPWAWIQPLLLWAALAGGAVLGGFAYHRINLDSIWYAAAVALALSVLLGFRRRFGRH
jgi:uncharacterized membrane protein YoaK (UPF0700 family)